MLARSPVVVVSLAAGLALWACRSDDGPAPERSVLQTVPRCTAQTDCVSGEECLDGICRQMVAGTDAGASAIDPLCTPSCSLDQICIAGVCYAIAQPIDAGTSIDPCGGICLGTQTCNASTGQCQATF